MRGQFFDPRGPRIKDTTGAPGPQWMKAGNREAGFFGFVPPDLMGKIDGTTAFNGDNLRQEIGVGGSTLFSGTPWLKFSWYGKILFVAMKPLSRSISWDSIYNAGCVYGTGDMGTLPPAGRVGGELEITANNTITTTGSFLGEGSYDVVGSPGDTLVLAGWSNEENNGEFAIHTITDDTITLVEDTLVPESNSTARLWNKDNEVSQDTTVELDGLTYKVRLIRGAADDPVDSYADSDRGSRGDENEWDRLILPLHQRAKTGNWNYPAYAPESVECWGVGLTDEDLHTHNSFGSGSYSWCQEARDNSETFRRVTRGLTGASFLVAYLSWSTSSTLGFRPVLELL